MKPGEIVFNFKSSFYLFYYIKLKFTLIFIKQSRKIYIPATP